MKSLSSSFLSEPAESDPEHLPLHGVDSRQLREAMAPAGEQQWNVRTLGLTFFLLIAAYSGIENLMTTLHPEEGMGSVCMAIIYGTVALAGPLGPRAISVLGLKLCLLLCILGYLQFIVANWGLPRLVGNLAQYRSLVLGVSAVVLGLSACSLWDCQEHRNLNPARRWSSQATGLNFRDHFNRPGGSYYTKD